MSGVNQMPDITLDELGRLIRILGMLGSGHDGEVVNAARLACRWVAEHDTSWWTLLTPEPEPAVAGVVVAGADPGLLDALEKAHAADRAAAYRNGYQAGLAAMAQQVKAQAAAVQQPVHRWSGPASSVGGTVHAAQPPAGGNQGAAPGRPVAAPGTTGGANQSNPWPTGSWQWVAQELLLRHAAVPGVLRSREEAFVQDVLRRGFPSLTTAQEAWLRDIAGRSGLSW